jgi:membrane-associated phospholipid phosphatase
MYELSSAAQAASIPFEAILVWGLGIIRAIQTHANPALTLAARAVTFLGEPWPYLAVLPFILWCVDERRGFRLAASVIVANGVVNALKVGLSVPRPGALDPSVELVAPPDPWSTPSGHSAGAATLWPILALGRRAAGEGRELALAISFGIPFLVGLSRVYLGVHYPTDVLFGWAIGATVSLTALVAIPALERTPLFSRAVDPEARGFLAGIRRSLDAHREATGRSARSFKLLAAAVVAFALNAACPEDSSMGGAFFGLAVGYILLTDGKGDEDSRGRRFSARDGSIAQKAVRLALGLAALAVLYVGLKRVLPGVSSPYYTLARFTRYAILGLWASWGAPLAFSRLGLADTAKPAD